MQSKSRQMRLLALSILVVLLTSCATVPPSRTDDICSIYHQKRGWHSTAKKAQDKWGTSMHIAMAIMNQESSFNAKARPPRRYLLGIIPWRRLSSAYGYAQAIDGTWAAYLKSTGDYGRKRNNFADATDFIHWYMREASKRNLIPPNDAYKLYLNYHEGTGGYRRGTHNKKPWLLGVAAKVQQRSDKYRAQYVRCKDDFKPGFWGRLLGR